MVNGNSKKLMNLELKYFINSLDDGISWKASEERLFMIRTKQGNKKVRRMNVKQFKENKKNATLKELVYIFNANLENFINTEFFAM